jgi:phosphoenolpyruvate-protein phosphotransferase (PTS system enzyme I)
MEIKHGIPASPGIVIGQALVLDTEGVRIPRRHVPESQIPDEIIRLGESIDRATEDARKRQKEVTTRLGKSIGQMFASHALFLSDPAMRYDIEMLMRAEGYSAEYAVSRHIRSRVNSLEHEGNEFAARMRQDFIDVEKQLLQHLQGNSPTLLEAGCEGSIIIARDLTPSETALFNKDSVVAFATESGGPTSHTAIMAGALNIPAVVGLGRLLADVSGGDTVIIDGDEGVVIIEPDEATLLKYEELLRNKENDTDQYQSLKDAQPITRDGTTIRLLGNIEFPNEAVACLEKGATGVGLYRTEFLYLNKTHDPTEEEHYDAYCEVLRVLGSQQPVVIRTLDLGADKFSPVTANTNTPQERNPFLGLRSVRLCLQNRQLFKTQIRAILRASVHGDLRIMFPMVSTVLELRQCVSLLREVEEDLADAGIDYKPNVAIGTMIEVPSAALMADVLAKQVKFFSIGTNDLVQYTLAADRNNEMVANLYSPVDPAVLRLIQRVADVGNRQGIEVNVCGEMSGEPLYTALLLGLGIRQLSATPRKIPELKHVIRNLTLPETERVANEVLRMETAGEVTSYLRGQLRRFLPSVVD